MRLRSILRVTPFVALLAACGGDETDPTPTPVQLELGGSFRGAVDADRLILSSSDGRVLLDGLAPADVGDDAPITGFAVRDVETSFEMLFGAFKPTNDAKGPWKPARKLKATSDHSGVDLTDASGAVLARLQFSAPEPGHLIVDVAPGDGPERRFSWGFACDAEDHYAGFGAQARDVDHRGFTVPTWVQEQGIGKSEDDGYGPAWFLTGTRHASHLPIPQYLSRRGYILTTETDRRSIFALCSESEKASRVEVEIPSKIHVFDGPSPAQAIERATATFGRPRMPPKVAFAPWNDAIFGSDNVLAVAQKLRAAGIPSSVIWSEDWKGGEWSGDGYRLSEQWEVDTTLYPDMPKLSKDLHALGFDFHVYFNPFVYVGTKAWDETAPNGWLVKREDGTPYIFQGAKLTDTGLIDLDHPEGRAWVVKKMKDAIALGADGWMNDFAEWLPTDGVTYAGPSYDRHNHYAVQWQEVAREAIDSVNDGQERLFFGRSGWFGTPALADVIWAGDQRTDFEPDDGMPTIVPIGIGLGLVGVSTYGHDIAGYQAATNPGSTKEVFFRWTEMGAWSPVMRTHHGAQPKLNWSWDADEETTAHFKRYAEQHMALVPYLMGLAKVANTSGLPIWRGLMIAYPEDANVWPIVDEVLLGDGVLIAPVLAAGLTSRPVYLPEGRWYPWAGGAAVAGGTTIEAPAPMGEIPVYARAGAVVPQYPNGVSTLVHGSAEVPDASSVGDDRVIAVFLGAGGGFTEAGGLDYVLTHAADASGDVTMKWNGAEVGSCGEKPALPCFSEAAGAITARVTGPGKLELSFSGQLAATVEAKGGAADRALTFDIRR